ncbi:hydantoinase/oxoprolinase family protein [Desulfosporosinus meridiei]|uniref:N-methylhydantoinase A/acetone carboxylase, beta subunit n=1 Tax=Desulfosporosinus meridiei (strain ATCC BAA-275 / DSM 13257 / KCTC 12902 / NCIMB 13706 / S10) TaxID=768704 RepID=J7IRW5_DESMD|nr:hydantoinase/oxoprolinase family protein [Desulfosporosinus meridiei]AFQ44390.1 N-methylhydantoinase A/acetone carboxylase, beta subunit [Desulfosporosinus meridiei DSM 13257]
MFNRIGIDVGGTYTDAVYITNGQIQHTAKVPTQSENLVETLMNAFDNLKIQDEQEISQITVSTTLVTNAILQNRIPPVKLFLFSGNGMKVDALPWPVTYTELSGEMDYRGREITSPDQEEWQKLNLADLEDDYSHVAIVGKFSHRNSLHEEQLAAYLKEHNPLIRMALGHEWGQSNFYRRSLTTYLNLGVSDLYQQFVQQLQAAVRARNIQAPIFILKADGGSLPLAKIRPIDSIYSGPAASVLAALTQTSPDESSIIVDIGGTTTDIGLALSGVPLLSSKGARIGEFSTLVRSLAVRSIPVGGDSVVRLNDQGVVLENYRLGSAYCLGGANPTPTDAMRYLQLIDYGDLGLAEEGLGSLLPSEQRTPETLEKLALDIINIVVEKIARAVDSLQREWQEEPAYKVWEVLHPQENKTFRTIVSGGGARGITTALGIRLKTPVQLGVFPEVSNALGAALSKPTFDCTLHLDTYMKQYRVEETGEQGKWMGALRPHREVEGFIEALAQQQAADYGIEVQDMEKESFDFFPIVQNYQTVGQIVRGSVHVRPGVIGRVQG